MKVTHKFGLSTYTLKLNDEETAAWKAASQMPKFLKKTERKNIFRSAYIRTYFGGTENAIKALTSLESDLKKFEKTIGIK